MPELPEVEAIARLLDEATRGATVGKIHVTGISTLKSFDPPTSSIEGHEIARIYRRGKHILIDFSGGTTMLMHLMSAGRLQLFDKEGSLRDKTTRMIIGLVRGDELRLREFGTKQSAWVKCLRSDSVQYEEILAGLGPDAWPGTLDLRALFTAPRPLHSILRDQHVIAGIGRSWADEILHLARLSPFKRATDLSDEERRTLSEAILSTMQRAIDHYEDVLSLPIPDKLPLPLTVHRHQGEPCPRCAMTLEAVHFENHTICYCPACQTGGKKLNDRRLSRLLK